MTNFDSDRAIILYYDVGAGGRFLANSLSLSSDCVMMNSRLAKMQLDGELSQKQKLSTLLSRLDKNNNPRLWNDFDLNDKDWFGMNYVGLTKKFGVIDFHEFNHHELKDMLYTDKLFQYVSINNTKYFFMTCHGPLELENILLIWKNAKIVSFKNQNLFKLIRNMNDRSKMNPYDDQLKLRLIWSLIPEEERGDWEEPPIPTEKPSPLAHLPTLNSIVNNIPENLKPKVLDYLNDPKICHEISKNIKPKYSIPVPKLYSEYRNITEKEKKILESENTSEEFVHPNSMFIWGLQLVS